MPELSIFGKSQAVMVDRYSASASEIFAGAIQDYQRGIIIGQKTFGKGTVQKLDDLSSGQIKITESKFYRITGAGMQNKGIHPDIVYQPPGILKKLVKAPTKLHFRGMKLNHYVSKNFPWIPI